jgi:(1->4)-alpha-D-glucan 1-alpha-D-glucosylmutase
VSAVPLTGAAAAPAGPSWRAAYRLQLHPGFTFADAADAVPYLADLGVSHVYLSPVLEAGPGSTHGYDVTDHGAVRAALGGRSGLERLTSVARDHGLGLLVDWVPNHMAIGAEGAGNEWWWDVLANGPTSAHAGAFDIDWAKGRLLLPVLDDHLRRVVESGRLRVAEADDGALHVVAGSQRFPLRPETDAELRERAGDEPGGLEALLAALGEEPTALLGVLAAQHYRLTRWQLANREVRHRRFFDVTELVGVRVDDPEVFDATHGLLLELAAEGTVQGIRLDHPDGLRDPEGYLHRLAAALPTTPLWVEKILSPGEELRGSWPVAGTTGYDFCDLVTRLQLHDDGLAALEEWFVARSGRSEAFRDEAVAAKREALGALLGADLDRCATLGCGALAVDGWDAAHAEVRRTLTELAVELDVYRTYIRPGTDPDETDLALLDAALERARPRLGLVDATVVDELVEALTRPRSPIAAELAVRFQQLSAPATAKGVEDTAIYRWAPMVATAEVGSHPDLGGLGPEDFHAAMGATARRWPDRMLDTSTHDTKRSEDVRARATALSEVPAEWIGVAEELLGRTPPHPEPALALIGLQTLVAAWPISAERFGAYLVKAAREAKTDTSWTEPDEDYEALLVGWARTLLDDPGARSVLERFTERLSVAGWRNSLVQLVLKLTSPGVPVIYQGTELWDGSLVDPDNRRPVDLDERRELLDRVAGDHVPPGPGPEAKLVVLHRVLGLRARRPTDLAGTAPHTPLEVVGPAARHVVAFARGEGVAVVAPRLLTVLEQSGGWQGTEVVLPDGPTWTDLLGSGEHRGRVPVERLLDGLPVAVLEATPGTGEG